jgi:hypothetical protein
MSMDGTTIAAAFNEEAGDAAEPRRRHRDRRWFNEGAARLDRYTRPRPRSPGPPPPTSSTSPPTSPRSRSSTTTPASPTSRSASSASSSSSTARRRQRGRHRAPLLLGRPRRARRRRRRRPRDRPGGLRLHLLRAAPLLPQARLEPRPVQALLDAARRRTRSRSPTSRTSPTGSSRTSSTRAPTFRSLHAGLLLRRLARGAQRLTTPRSITSASAPPASTASCSTAPTQEHPARDIRPVLRLGGDFDLIAPTSPTSRWTQDDFTGGTFQYRYDKDAAMFADCTGYVPGQQSRSLITAPPLYFKKAFNPAAQSNPGARHRHHHAEGDVHRRRLVYVSSSTASSVTARTQRDAVGQLARRREPLLPGRLLRPERADHLRPAQHDPDHRLADAAPHLPTTLDTTPYAIGSFDPMTPLPKTKGKVGKGMAAQGQLIVVGIGLRLYTCAPPEDVTDVTASRPGRTSVASPATGRLGRLQRHDLHPLRRRRRQDAARRLRRHRRPADHRLPVQLPRPLSLRLRRPVFVGGSGTDINGADRYAELYEVTGASVRLVRTFAPESYQSRVTHPKQHLGPDRRRGPALVQREGQADVGLRPDLRRLLRRLRVQQTNLILFKHVVGRERLFCWGTHDSDTTKHGLYRIAISGDGVTATRPPSSRPTSCRSRPSRSVWDKIVVLSRYAAADVVEYSTDGGATWTGFLVGDYTIDAERRPLVHDLRHQGGRRLEPQHPLPPQADDGNHRRLLRRADRLHRVLHLQLDRLNGLKHGWQFQSPAPTLSRAATALRHPGRRRDRHQLWDVGRAEDAPLHRRRRQAYTVRVRRSPSSSRSSARTPRPVPPRSLLLPHAARAVSARGRRPGRQLRSAGSGSKAPASSSCTSRSGSTLPRHPRHRPGEAHLRRARPGASTSSSTAARPRRRSSSRRSKTTTTSTSCSPSTRSSSTRSRRSPTRSSTRSSATRASSPIFAAAGYETYHPWAVAPGVFVLDQPQHTIGLLAHATTTSAATRRPPAALPSDGRRRPARRAAAPDRWPALPADRPRSTSQAKAERLPDRRAPRSRRRSCGRRQPRASPPEGLGLRSSSVARPTSRVGFGHELRSARPPSSRGRPRRQGVPSRLERRPDRPPLPGRHRRLPRAVVCQLRHAEAQGRRVRHREGLQALGLRPVHPHAARAAGMVVPTRNVQAWRPRLLRLGTRRNGRPHRLRHRHRWPRRHLPDDRG